MQKLSFVVFYNTLSARCIAAMNRRDSSRLFCATYLGGTPVDTGHVINLTSSVSQTSEHYGTIWVDTISPSVVFYHAQLLCVWVILSRKCGVGFIYLQEGCGKTCKRVNDAMPHTWIVWVYAQSVHRHIAIQEMNAIRLSPLTKTSTFSCKDHEKHFRKYVWSYQAIRNSTNTIRQNFPK